MDIIKFLELDMYGVVRDVKCENCGLITITKHYDDMDIPMPCPVYFDKGRKTILTKGEEND